MGLVHVEEPPFRLQSPPNELWGLTRLRNELGGVSKSTIYEWVRSGRLSKPWTHRKGRSYWAPEAVRPALGRPRTGGNKQHGSL
jgi:hypothetical protein